VIDPLFPPDSYGYRPGEAALDAVGASAAAMQAV
jgi:retron-type reverse transcriptase